MAEAIGEMEREEEEHGQVPDMDDTGGTEGQRRAQTSAPRTWPPTRNTEKEEEGRQEIGAGTAGRQRSSDEHQEASGNR